MSRVDEALQAFEKKKAPGTTARPQSHEPQRFTLNGYARENVTPAQAAVNGRGAARPAAPASQAPLNFGLDERARARLVTDSAGSVQIEQFRRLAAVLHDLQVQQGLKTLMLTSALPAEGKTLTTLNLALTLSESFERRVLIIEADLRRPTLHKMLGVKNAPGLAEVLRGEAPEVPFRQVSSHLTVLTGGRAGQTALAGLTSPRMASLIEDCATRFDWVLLDTPPVGVLPDAQPLARLTRAVLFVIAAGVTPSSAVERAVAEIGSDSIIGTVLNRVDERCIPSAGYYNYDSTDDDPSA